jgi:hypothetical protein
VALIVIASPTRAGEELQAFCAIPRRVPVPGRDRVADAVGDRRADGVVERGARPAAEAHVRYGRLARLVVPGDPVDAGDHARRGSAPVAVEDADADEPDALGDAVRRAADRAGHVRPVAVAVVGRAAVDSVVAADSAAAELAVVEADAGVDHVGLHAGAGVEVHVGRAERARPLVDAFPLRGTNGESECIALRAVRHQGRSVQLEAEARKAPAGEPVERRLVLLGRLTVQRLSVAVPVLEEGVGGRVHEIDVIAVALLGLVARSGVVGGERRLAVQDEPCVLGLEELELALDELDEAPAHAP